MNKNNSSNARSEKLLMKFFIFFGLLLILSFTAFAYYVDDANNALLDMRNFPNNRAAVLYLYDSEYYNFDHTYSQRVTVARDGAMNFYSSDVDFHDKANSFKFLHYTQQAGDDWWYGGSSWPNICELYRAKICFNAYYQDGCTYVECGGYPDLRNAIGDQNYTFGWNQIDSFGIVKKGIDETPTACRVFDGSRYYADGYCCNAARGDKVYGSKLCTGGVIYGCNLPTTSWTTGSDGVSYGLVNGASIGTRIGGSFCSSSGTWDACATSGTTIYNGICYTGDANSNPSLCSAESGSFSGTVPDTNNRCCGVTATLGFISSDGKYLCNNKNGWQWQNQATIGAFKINPVDSTYDAISNGDKWYRCDPLNLFNFPSFKFNATNLNPTPSGDYVFGQPASPTFSGGVVSSDTTGLQVVTQDTVFQGITQDQVILSNTIQFSTPQGIVTATISSKEIKGNDKISLTIQGLPAVSLLRNNTGFKIKVSNNNAQIEVTSHSNATPNSGILGPVEITLPPISSGVHDLNVTIVSSVTNSVLNNYFWPNAFTKLDDPISNSFNPILINPSRFFCYRRGGTSTNGAIAECCGPDYRYCNNAQQDNVRISGGPTGLLKDYYGDYNKNNVLRVNFPKLGGYPGQSNPTVGIPSNYIYNADNLLVTDWSYQYSYYNSLEFDVLLLGTKRLSISLIKTDNTEIPIQGSVLSYSTTGDDLGKWHHIRIPLTAAMKSNIKTIKLYANGIDLYNDYYSLPGEKPKLDGANQFLIFFVDRFYLSSGLTKYCATNTTDYGSASTVGNWIGDLDSERDACNNVASYKWTGVQNTGSASNYGPCCGDDQGATGKFNESYVTPIAGCWQGSYTANNTPANNNTLLFSDGTFYSCLNQNLASDLQKPTTTQTTTDVQNNPNICANKGSWYCDFDTKWKDALSYNATRPVNALKNNTGLDFSYFNPNTQNSQSYSNISCCPQGYCFDGSANGCVAPYDNPKTLPIGKVFGDTGYRCSNTGNWTLVSLRKDFNQEDSGYCNDDTECYATADRRCFKSGEWDIIGGKDRFCFNGNWTTRTKYVAATLLNYASTNGGSDWALYCDKPENSLGIEEAQGIGTIEYNRVNYFVSQLISNPSKSTFNDYVGFDSGYSNVANNGLCGRTGSSNIPCVNNFCILRYTNILGDHIILGTSLNKALNESTFPLQEGLGFNRTRDVVGAISNDESINLIYQSPQSGNFYYSSQKQVLFYTVDNGISLTPGTLGENILNVILHPVKSIVNFISSVTAGPQSAELNNLLSKVTDFDRVYFAVKGTKTVVGFQETKFTNVSGVAGLQTFLSINYTNFNNNICNAIIYPLGCNQTDSSQYVFGTKTGSQEFTEWKDLTAKLRIS